MSGEDWRRWQPTPPAVEPLRAPALDFPAFRRAFRSGPLLVNPADVSVRLLTRRSPVLTDRPRVELLHHPTGRVVTMDMGETYRDVISNALQVLNAHLVMETDSEIGLSQA